MFTGIIEAVGKVRTMVPVAGDMRLTIDSSKLDLSDVVLGDSIAVNGVCLTVVALSDNGFSADVSRETMSHSSFAQLKTGSRVNLEKALTPTSRLGGHLVSGHVDGVGEILQRSEDARSIRLRVRAPDVLARYIAHKGSITVDGISLTVNAIDGAIFELNIVPHTSQETTVDEFVAGRTVNLEVDLIARYLERLLQGDQAAKQTQGLSEAFLAEHGFLSARRH